MKTIKISRKKWLAGDKYSVNGVLWNPKQQQGCCLGHVIHQTARVSWEKLANLEMPSEFYRGKTSNCLVTVEEDICGHDIINSTFSERAAQINDDIDLSRKQKERKLIALFKKNGLGLVFVP